MAFQRPFLISLKRADPYQKWGFSIKGGKDYCEPLTVQMVAEDSLAEKYGLRECDEVIQVGRVNVQDLTLSQVHELMARCGNKIEMFVVREDIFSPRRGKEPPVVKAVVHNPYNSPLSLYSTENIADTLGKQTEVLTEGHISAEEDEGPESLSFKQKSAVFQLLEEQSKQETVPYTRAVQQSSTVVTKPKSAPPPPPKPKPPAVSDQQLLNGYDAPRPQVYQDQQRSTSRVEYQTTTQKVANQYQYQQEPTQYQQSTVHQASYQKTPGYQSPLRENVQQPISNYQQLPGGYQSQVTYQSSYQQPQDNRSPVVSSQQQFPGGYQSQVTYQSSHQQPQGNRSPVVSSQQQHPASYQSQVTYQSTHQQSQGNRSPVVNSHQQHPGFQSPVTSSQQQYQGNRSPVVSSQQQCQSPATNSYQQLNQVNYRQSQQSRDQDHESQSKHQQKVRQSSPAVSKAEFKIGPPPPARSTSAKQDSSSMTAIYKQQYEQHLQKQYEQQMYLNQLNDEESSKPKAHIIEGEIFEHNSSSGTPISYKTPPAAPPKPHWPPPERNNEQFRGPQPSSPSGMDFGSVWPPKKSSAVELPRTGFNPAAVREQGTGRRCVWPPRADEEFRSGRNTPQSPVTGRRIQWNPSPSPPLSRRTVFSPSHSPARKRDIPWPPPASMQQDKENFHRPSPRMSRKAEFDDYIHEHASINVPQTYRPPPGTQHIEFH